jgi:hypothetical protein
MSPLASSANDAAAIKVQACVRGWTARRQVSALLARLIQELTERELATITSNNNSSNNNVSTSSSSSTKDEVDKVGTGSSDPHGKSSKNEEKSQGTEFATKSLEPQSKLQMMLRAMASSKKGPLTTEPKPSMTVEGSAEDVVLTEQQKGIAANILTMWGGKNNKKEEEATLLAAAVSDDEIDDEILKEALSQMHDEEEDDDNDNDKGHMSVATDDHEDEEEEDEIIDGLRFPSKLVLEDSADNLNFDTDDELDEIDNGDDDEEEGNLRSDPSIRTEDYADSSDPSIGGDSDDSLHGLDDENNIINNNDDDHAPKTDDASASTSTPKRRSSADQIDVLPSVPRPDASTAGAKPDNVAEEGEDVAVATNPAGAVSANTILHHSNEAKNPQEKSSAAGVADRIKAINKKDKAKDGTDKPSSRRSSRVLANDHPPLTSESGDAEKPSTTSKIAKKEKKPKTKTKASSKGDGKKKKRSKSADLDDDDDRALDLAARQYLIHSSATKIQALARGRRQRKVKHKEQARVLLALKKFRQSILVPLKIELGGTDPTTKIEKDAGGKKKLTRIAARQLQLHKAATKIQAVARGRATRRVDLKGMMYAVAWLQQYRKVEAVEAVEAAKKEASGELVEDSDDSDSDNDDPEVSAFVRRQVRIRKSVITIQRMARGYLCRKVNYGAMMRAMEWVKEYQRVYGPSKVKKAPDPKVKDLRKACAVLEDMKLLKPVSSLNESSQPPVNVKQLLNTWEWLKAQEATAGKKRAAEESKERVVADDRRRGETRRSRVKSKPRVKQLSGLWNFMEAHSLHSSSPPGMIDTGRRGFFELDDIEESESKTESRVYYDESVVSGGSGPKAREAKVYYDESIQSGGIVGEAQPKTKVYYDESVVSGGNGPEGKKNRVFYDASVQSGGTGESSKPKTKVYYDESVVSGGTGPEAKGVKVFYDASVQSGGAGGGTNARLIPIPLPQIGELVNLWRWLESNQMDMDTFKKWEDGDPEPASGVVEKGVGDDREVSPDRRDSLKIINSSILPENIQGDQTQGDKTAATIEIVGNPPSLVSMVSYWNFSRKYVGPVEDQHDDSSEGSPIEWVIDEDERAGEKNPSIGAGPSQKEGKVRTPSWMKPRPQNPDLNPDDNSQGSGPIEWVLDDDGQQVQKSKGGATKSGVGSSQQSGRDRVPSWMKPRPQALSKVRDDESTGSGPTEWIIDEDGERVQKKADGIPTKAVVESSQKGKETLAPWMQIRRQTENLRPDDASEGSGPIEWAIDDVGNQVQNKVDSSSNRTDSEASQNKGKERMPSWMKPRPQYQTGNEDDSSEGSRPIEWVIDDDGVQVQKKGSESNVKQPSDKVPFSSRQTQRPAWMSSPWLLPPLDNTDDSSEESDPIEWVLDDEEGGHVKSSSGESTNWMQSASNNPVMKTFSWMQQKGVDFDKVVTVAADETQKSDKQMVPDKKSSQSTKDMEDMLDWLDKKGLFSSKRKATTKKGTSKPEQHAGATELEEAKREVKLAKTEGPPSSSHMASALDWLENRSYVKSNTSPPTDQNHSNVQASEEDTTGISKIGPTVDNHILYSLSWLKKHGYDLDKSIHEGASRAGSTGASLEKTTPAIDKDQTPTPASSGTPSHREMMSALGFLEGRSQGKSSGASGYKSTDSVTVQESSATMPSGVANVFSKDMENALSWLEGRGISADSSASNIVKAKPRYDRNRRASTKDRSSAMKWLEKSGIAVDDSKLVQEFTDEDTESDGFPSPDEISKTMVWLKAGGGDKEATSVDSRKPTPTTKPPSSVDMESALTWLQKREKAFKKPAIPSWKQKLLLAKSVLNGDEKPSWLQRRIDAINKAEILLTRTPPTPKVETVDTVTAKPTTDDIESRKLESETKSPDKPMPSWKEKLTAAKNTILEQEGETRPKWLQKRIEKVQVASNGKLGRAPSAAEMKNAMDFLEKKETGTQQEMDETTQNPLAMESPTKKKKGAILKDGRKFVKKLEPTRGAKASGWFQPPASDLASKWLEQGDKTSKKGNDGGSSARDDKSSKKASISSPQTRRSFKKEEDISSTKSTTNDKKKDKKEMTQREIDIEKALRWLKSGKVDTVEDIAYYKKLDSVIPRPDGQSLESRAKEMAKAMKWVKRQGVVTYKAGKESRDSAPPETPKKSKDAANDLSKDVSKDLSSPRKSRRSLKREPSPKRTAKDSSPKKDAKATTKSDNDLVTPKKLKKSALKGIPSSPEKERTSPKKKEAAESPRTSRRVPQKEEKSSEMTTLAERDLKNAMAWLKNRDDEGLDDSAYFKKLDKMLAKKPGQSQAARAKEMVKALQWVRKTTMKKDEGETRASVEEITKKADDRVKSSSNKKVEKKDDKWSKVKDSLLGAKVSKDNSKEKTSFKPRTSILASILAEAKKDTKTSNYSTNPPATGEGSAHDEPRKPRASILPETKIKPKAPNDNVTRKHVAKDTGRDEQDKCETHAPEQDIAKANVTVHTNTGSEEGSGKSTGWSKVRTTLPTIMMDRDTTNALKWMINEGADVGGDAALFKKVDSMLPKKPGQSNDERAIEMAKAMKFLRKKGLAGSKKPDAKEESKSGSKEESKPEKDLENALAWVRAKESGGNVNSLEDTAFFTKLDKMVAKKKGQGLDDRAKEMVKLLAWLRKKGLAA